MNTIDVESTDKWSALSLNHMIEIIRRLNDKPMPYSWYDDPVDQMLVFMNLEPRPGAKYTVPRG